MSFPSSSSSSYLTNKPENALRRALELRAIGQAEASLSLLHEVLSSRRHRTWSPPYEKIMLTYLDLCLELNRARDAKDGLHQYRNLSQSQAPGSLGVVIKYLLEQADARCRAAKEAADAREGGGGGGGASLLAAATAAAGSETGAVAGTATTSTTGAGDEAPEEEDDAGFAGGDATTNIVLLSTMSSDPLQTQRDSALLLPALKFLWEAYRAVLDILKSNSKLERLYHSTAMGALSFCNTYKRRTEFRRLCDMLRMHLGNLQKFGGTPAAMAALAAAAAAGEDPKTNSKVKGWEGWTTESIELHLQTRFTQLETASKLHLYTEGFRTVEDIYNILQISHTRRRVAAAAASAAVAAGTPPENIPPPPPPPKAKLMAAYYEKLTTLFWVSENYLFHAYAWYKFYTLCREYNRGMTLEQKRLQASAVLLSALCIPTLTEAGMNGGAAGGGGGEDGGALGAATVKDDIAKEKTARMATLLGFHTKNPTREALLSEIRAKNVMNDLPDYLVELYRLLEENTNPLLLVKRARPLLDRLRTEVGAEAISAIQDEDEEEEEKDGGEEKKDAEKVKQDDDEEEEEEGTLGRYVGPLTSIVLLKLLYSLSKSYHTISLDHVKSLTAGLGVSFTQVEKAIVSATLQKASMRGKMDHRANCLRFGDAAAAAAASSESGGGGGASPLESKGMRSQLTVLSKQLAVVCAIIDPPDVSHKTRVRHDLFAQIRASLEPEHESMLARKDLIEKRKEEVERLAQEMVKEEDRKKREKEALQKAEEERRLLKEEELRKRQKLDQIQKEMELTKKRQILQAMGRNPETLTEKELDDIDADKLAKEHVDRTNKEKEEAERKVRETSRRLDYIVRATRLEELPLVRKLYEERVAEERKRYQAEVVEKAERAKLKWEEDWKDKQVLEAVSFFDFRATFEEGVMAGRRAIHDGLCRQEDARAEMEAERAKIGRARKRKEEEAHRVKEEEERLERQEEERLKQEEQERKEEEERVRKEEERRRKEAAEEELRKKEMAAMEERRKKERERAPEAPPSRDLEAASSAAGGGGGKYVPPSRRGAPGGGGGGGDGGSRYGGDSRGGGGGGGGGGFDSRGGGYGGGRYEGSRFGDRGGGSGDRFGDRGGGGDRFGDRGGGGDRFGDRGGGGDRFGDRGGGGGGGGDRFGDRGGGGDRGRFGDRGGGGGGDRFGDRDRGGDRFGDRGGGGDRFGDRGGGGDRFGDRGGGGDRFGGGRDGDRGGGGGGDRFGGGGDRGRFGDRDRGGGGGGDRDRGGGARDRDRRGPPEQRNSRWS